MSELDDKLAALVAARQALLDEIAGLNQRIGPLRTEISRLRKEKKQADRIAEGRPTASELRSMAAARRRAIYAEVDSGKPVAQVAALFGISSSRVHSLISHREWKRAFLKRMWESRREHRSEHAPKD